MTPERVAGLVVRWVRLYTRNLPVLVAERRIAEIEADLHDHVAHERASGVGDRRIARDVVSRMVRGLAADVAWRGRQARRRSWFSTREKTMKTTNPLFRSSVRVAVGVAAILSLPAVAMLFTHEVVWSPADFVLAGALLVVLGTALELAARKAGNLVAAVVVAGLGGAAGILGAADDAPGLVLLGMLLVASAFVLGARTARARHSR